MRWPSDSIAKKYHALASSLVTIWLAKNTYRVYFASVIEGELMNNIASLRRRAGIKQGELAERLGWSQARLSNYESGRRLPGLFESRQITASLKALGVNCELDDVFPDPSDSLNVA